MKTQNHSVVPIESGASRYRLGIKKSPIHVRGVFAFEAIPRNRQVIEYTGERVRFRQALRYQHRLKRLGKPLNVYFAALSRRWVINGAVGGNGSQFINHCCDPNLGVRRVRGRLLFFSRRPIRAGDELTFDYRYQKGVAVTTCHCGSPKCRGTINCK